VPNPEALGPEIWLLTQLSAAVFLLSVIALAPQLFDIPVWQGLVVIGFLLAIIFLLDYLVRRRSKRQSRITMRQKD
jgi:membrane protein implicated in regulation of membrane protease activity